MASEGPNSPDTGENDASHGTNAWTQQGSVTASDGSAATCSNDSGAVTQYLKATDFDFAIPSGATIDGIVVEIQKGDLFTSNTFDNRVRIVKGGTVGSTDRSNASAWTAAMAYTTYGSSSDLWGESWTDSDINATTFGVVIAATATGGTGFARVDHIRITVHYTEGGGGTAVPVFRRHYQLMQTR